MPVLTGLILAGGAGLRVDGHDKAWLDWHGKPLFEHTLARLQPQTGTVWISANRHPERYLPWLDGHRQPALSGVIGDDWPDLPGPLAGLASCLPRIAASVPASPWVLVTPVDTPALPVDLGQQLWQGLQRAAAGVRVAVARHEGQSHWLHLLVHVSVVDSLDQRLQARERRVQDWCRSESAVMVDIAAPTDAFANLNRWAQFSLATAPEDTSSEQKQPDAPD